MEVVAPKGERGLKYMRSIILLFVITFAFLGLLLGLAESYDIPKDEMQFPTLPENIAERDPEIQQKLFEDCIKDARFSGVLTQEEYDRCAYSIYG